MANVSVQGYQTYRPLYRERRWRNVRKVCPLFPHYLFVQIDTRRDDWKKLSSTRGVSQIFMSGDLPSRVPDRSVEYFRSLENSLGYIELEEHEAPRFSTDQSVMVTRGAFAEKFGVYQGLAGTRGDRMRVLFEILGKSVTFEVDAHSLVAA